VGVRSAIILVGPIAFFSVLLPQDVIALAFALCGLAAVGIFVRTLYIRMEVCDDVVTIVNLFRTVRFPRSETIVLGSGRMFLFVGCVTLRRGSAPAIDIQCTEIIGFITSIDHQVLSLKAWFQAKLGVDVPVPPI
jgi:hypothetical protein